MSETPPDPPLDPYGAQPTGGQPPPPPANPYGIPEAPGPEPTQPYAQPPYGQPASPPPYGQQPVNAYGQPAYPAYGGPARPDHPQSTTVLVLGILGLVLCGVLAPFAWVLGGRVVREIDASGGQLGGRSSANAGRICGIIGTVLIGLGVAFFALLLIGLAGSIGS